MEAGREFFYHGSCKNCHHFHTGCKLRLPSDGESYLPYHCEECNLYMFGIGISSPRSSLASLETLHGQDPSNPPLRPSDSVACCSDNLQANTTPQGPSRLSEDQATVAPESTFRGRSLASSSQTRLSATNTRPGGAASSTGAEPIENDPNSGHEVRVSRIANAHSTPDTSRTARSSPFHSRFAARNTAKKVLEHLRRHMPWRKAPKIEDAGDQQDTIPPMTKDTGIMSDPIIPSTLNPIETSRLVTVAPPEESLSANNVPTIALLIEQSASSARPSHEATAAEPNGEPWDPLATKNERIRIQRRQLTLAKEYLDQRTCHCSSRCPCMTSGPISTIPSTSPRPSDLSSLSLSNIPSHRLSHLLLRRSTTSSLISHFPFRNPSPSRHVAFAGTHLETPYPPPQDLTIPSEDGDEQRFSRVSASTVMTLASQVTTAVNSSSSGSGGPRHMSQSRRMNSLPVLSPRQLERICDLLHVDRNAPEMQAPLRLLAQVSASYAESSGTTRTNSLDVVSAPRGDVLLEGMTGSANGIGRGELGNGSTMSLPDLPEVNGGVVNGEGGGGDAGARVGREGGEMGDGC